MSKTSLRIKRTDNISKLYTFEEKHGPLKFELDSYEFEITDKKGSTLTFEAWKDDGMFLFKGNLK